jgi:AcrR family transcriptional regulator
VKDLSHNKKYHKLLKTARELFWKHGFRRVSVEEICQRSGVSKMTFYRFFTNKIELAKSVFDREAHEGVQNFRNILHEDISPAEKVKKIVLLKVEGTHNISREFLADFYTDPASELRVYVEEKTRNIWEEMLNDFRQAQQKGWFRKDFKPEFLIEVSMKLVEIVKDEKLLQLYSTPQDLVLELTNLIAYGISPHE